MNFSNTPKNNTEVYYVNDIESLNKVQGNDLKKEFVKTKQWNNTIEELGKDQNELRQIGLRLNIIEEKLGEIYTLLSASADNTDIKTETIPHISWWKKLFG